MEIWKLCEGQSCGIAIQIDEVHLGPSLIVLPKQGYRPFQSVSSLWQMSECNEYHTIRMYSLCLLLDSL